MQSKNSKIKCLGFDLGKVLFDFDYNLGMQRIKDRLTVPLHELERELFCTDFTYDFEKGLIPIEKFYLSFKEKFCDSLDYDEFVATWCSIFSPQYEVINLVKKLKGKFPLYLISNINQMHFSYLLEKYPEVFSLFDKLILSFEVKAMKPDKKIYLALKDAAGLKYNQILYIDDRQDLIFEAKKLKLNCIQFVNYKQLVKELNNFGINI